MASPTRTKPKVKTPLNITVHIPFVPPGEKSELTETLDYATVMLQVLNRITNFRHARPEIEELVAQVRNKQATDILATERRLKELINPPDGGLRYSSLFEIGNWFLAVSESSDEDAAIQLLLTALSSTTMLQVACELKPELFQRLSYDRTLWPVLASTDPEWHAHAQKQIEAIKLGDKTVQAHFSKAKRSTASVRQWAEAALETLQSNHRRVQEFRFVHKWLFLLELDYKVSLTDIPEWARECGDLPPFDGTTFPMWWKVAKTMLKDRCPEIEKRPEWTGKRNWQRSKNDWRKVTPGRARAAVYEAKALRGLRPGFVRGRETRAQPCRRKSGSSPWRGV